MVKIKVTALPLLLGYSVVLSNTVALCQIEPEGAAKDKAGKDSSTDKQVNICGVAN